MLGKDTPSNPWATSSPQCQLIVANDVDDNDDDDYAPPALSNVFVLWLVFIFYLRPKKRKN